MAKTYLALGDSYTIGEQVLLSESFPYQTVQLLREDGIGICAPEIIAKTGWTTDELSQAIAATNFLKQYDFVSLLIGVNNQYKGSGAEEYKTEFEILLQKAVEFAGDDPAKVFVLSIPDWGVTPFADVKDRNTIAREIDTYNEACKMITEKSGCTFIEITANQREHNCAEMLAGDGLHPSGKEYNKWAVKLASAMSNK